MGVKIFYVLRAYMYLSNRKKIFFLAIIWDAVLLIYVYEQNICLFSYISNFLEFTFFFIRKSIFTTKMLAFQKFYVITIIWLFDYKGRECFLIMKLSFSRIIFNFCSIDRQQIIIDNRVSSEQIILMLIFTIYFWF